MNVLNQIYIVVPTVIGIALGYYSHNHIKLSLERDNRYFNLSNLLTKDNLRFKTFIGIKRSSPIMSYTNYKDRQGLNNEVGKTKVPIKWKTHINTNPSIADFEKAWKSVFGFNLDQCTVRGIIDFGSNLGFEVQTPQGSYSNAGFGFHTDEPVTNRDIFYRSGPNWSIDDNGNRYYKIDQKTMLPVNWTEVVAKETIANFLKNTQNNKSFLIQLDKTC